LRFLAKIERSAAIGRAVCFRSAGSRRAALFLCELKRRWFSEELRWGAKQFRPFWRVHVLAMICTMGGSALVVLNPLIMRWLIDGVIANGRVGILPIAAASVVGVLVANQLLVGLAGSISFRAGRALIFRVQLNVLRELQGQGARFHEHSSVGDRLYRVEQDVEQFCVAVGEVIPDSLRAILVTGMALSVMCFLNVWLTCLMLPLLPLFILLLSWYRRRLRAVADRVQQRQGAVGGFLQEHLAGIIQVQLLWAQKREARRFAVLSCKALDSQMERKVNEVVFGAVISFVIVLSLASVLGFGGYEVIVGKLTTGGLVAFYAYTLQLFGPLYSAADISAKIQRALASAARVIELTDPAKSVVDSYGAVSLTGHCKGNVELIDVSFSYPGSGRVVQGVSLRVEPGEHVVFVGENGSGKSTAVKLIARLYDVEEGAILIDGIDIRELKLKSLRHAIGFMPQEPVLFETTLRECLLYGKPDASQRELDEVAEVAMLEPVLRRLAHGWESSVGRMGGCLSGGERQRVALARVLIQRPRILLLDEATSQVDEVAEEEIIERVGRFLRGSSVIMVSHRSYAEVWADRVLRFENGRLAGGSGDSLVGGRQGRRASEEELSWAGG
jgi:ABC-type multidrug transport system fused ATPase/permease subunit